MVLIVVSVYQVMLRVVPMAYVKVTIYIVVMLRYKFIVHDEQHIIIIYNTAMN